MATEFENATPTQDEGMAQEMEGRVEQVYPLARQVSEALMGAVFPLKRDHLVWVARENEAPRTLISMLAGLPARSYASLDEVEQALDEGLAERPETGSSEPPAR